MAVFSLFRTGTPLVKSIIVTVRFTVTVVAMRAGCMLSHILAPG